MEIVKRTIHSSAVLCFLFFVLQGAGGSQPRNGVGGIVGIQAGQVTINWGSNDGIKEGMHFIAFRQNQMVHPQTGEYLSIERDVIGKIEITRVTPTYSVGRFVSTQKTPQVGDLVELVIDEDQQYPFESNQPELGTITNRNGNTITFNMGTKHGVENGLYFDVMRGSEKIGTAVVSRASESSSMASLTAGVQQVQIGDRVELAEQQQADMTVSGMAAASQGTAVPSPAVPSRPAASTAQYSSAYGAQEPLLFGTISAINGSTIRFDWLNRAMPASQGILAGIYRQEQLTHPVTGENLGAPLILIGQLRVDRTERNNGSGTMVSFQAAPRVGDRVGYIARSSSGGSYAAPAQPAPERPRWESGTMTRQASGLNQEVQSLQRELTYLRNLSARITAMEKNIAAQQKAMQSVQSQVRAIRKRLDELVSGVVPQEASLIGQQANPEVFGSHPDKSREYTFRVSDDFKVKLQMEDKTVLVSLDKDSVRIEEMGAGSGEVAMTDGMLDSGSAGARQQTIVEYPDRNQGDAMNLDELLGPGVQEEQPFYLKHWKMIAGALGGLIALYAVFSLFRRKKGGGKKSAAEKMEFDEEDAEEPGGDEGEAEDDEEFEEEEIEGI